MNIPREDITVGDNNIRVDTALGPGNSKGASPENRVFYTLSLDNSVGYGRLFSSQKEAQQDARKRLEQRLDFDNDSEPELDMDAGDFEYGSNILGDEPYLWGPANVKLVIWNEE